MNYRIVDNNIRYLEKHLKCPECLKLSGNCVGGASLSCGTFLKLSVELCLCQMAGSGGEKVNTLSVSVLLSFTCSSSEAAV